MPLPSVCPSVHRVSTAPHPSGTPSAAALAEHELPTTTALEQAPPSRAGKVFAWTLWDWGTQPFATVITTFVFAVYITSRSFGEGNGPTLALSTSTAIAGVLVALLAPVLGANADRTGRAVRNLRWQTWTLAIISASLFFIAPDPKFLWPGLLLLGIGQIISELAGVNYNSTIEQVASPRNVGRVSGLGWGMGYMGGILVLLLIFFTLIAPDRLQNGLDVRYGMLVCAAWTLVFTIPTFLVIKDQSNGSGAPAIGIVQAYKNVFGTIRGLWREQHSIFWFLVASALFRDGLSGVFAFGTVIASRTFGFEDGEVIIFGAAANIVAGAATMAFGMLDDWIGPRRVILISLGALVLCGTGVFLLHDGGKQVFWSLGLVMCMFVGPAQSAARSYLARVIPAGRSGEIFGLYATTGRAVSFLSPTLFGLAVGIGAIVTGRDNTQHFGILGIAAVLLTGLVAMLFVRSERAEAH